MTTIITKKGSGQPALDSLQEAELAVDITNGDLYTKASGQIVKLNGEGGTGNGNPVVISDNPPASPEEGDLWYSSKAGDEGLYCWDGEVWFEAGGANGADGENGQDAKQIWSETSPDGDIYYNEGNVGIGTNDPVGKFQVRVGTDLNIAMNQLTAEDVARISAYDDAVSASVPLALEGEYLKLRTGSQDRLTIDAAGNSNFSGKVTTPMVVSATLNGIGFGGASAASSAISPVNSDGTWQGASPTSSIGNAAAPWKDAHFSGTVTAPITHTILAPPGTGGNWKGGAYFFNNNFIPCTETGANSHGTHDLGQQGGDAANTFYWKDGYFTGTVTVEGNRPVSTKLDLISTLSTLRNATKDETTLEGLRDSIGNAIGGLIEKFEAEIAGTMEISE